MSRLNFEARVAQTHPTPASRVAFQPHPLESHQKLKILLFQLRFL